MHRNIWPYTHAEIIEYGRMGDSARLERHRERIERERREREEDESAEEDESDEEEKVISTTQSFKSDECVIYLTNPPNVLFCNCGHLCLCVECDKVKSLNTCPVCKTESTIKITIE